MKMTKRILAGLLLVCMLVSFAVPATFAENEQAAPIVYDFRLYANEALLAVETNGTISTKNTTFNTAYDGTNRVYNWVVANYGDLGWGYENSVGTNSTANKNFEFRNSGNSNQGMRMLIPNEGQWAAIRIHVPVAGTYAIEAAAVQLDLSYTADMYIFPATTEYTSYSKRMSTTDISSCMTSGNKVGQVVIGEGDQVLCRISDGYCFKEAGDYIIVFAAPQGGISNGKGAHLGAMALLPVEADPNETTAPSQISGTDVDYKFNLIVDYPDQFGSYASPTLLTKVKAVLNGLYPNTVNWNFETTGNGADKAATDKIQLRNNQGLRLYGAAGDWQAFRLSGITAGTYDITLNSQGNSTMNTASAYLVKITEGVNPADGMTSANLVLSGMQKTGEYYAPQVVLEEGEYYLVIKHTAIGNAGYWCLTDLSLKAVEDASDETTAPEETTVPQESTTVPEETTQPGETFVPEVDANGIFDFNLFTAYAPIFDGMNGRGFDKKAIDTTGAGIVGENGKEMTTLQLLDALYTRNYLDWNYVDSSFQNGKGLANIQIRSNQGLRIYSQAGDYVAFRLNVPEAGIYNLLLTSGGSNTADIYLFEAGIEIAAGMCEENLLVKDVKTADKAAITLEKTLEAKEYILVARCKTNEDGTYWTLSQLAMEKWIPKQAKPAVDKKVYDFDIVAMDANFEKKTVTNRYDDNTAIKTVMQNMYDADQIQWLYENCSTSFNAKEFTFRPDAFRFKGAKNTNKLNNPWFAVRLDTPGTETYDVRLASSDKSQICANIYLIPAPSTLTLTKDQIEAGMTSENLLVSNALIDDKGTFYLGEYTFGNDEEYVLVFDFIKGSALYLEQIEMTKDGLVADGTVKKAKTYNGTVYNLDLADQMDGIYTESKINMPDVYTDMNARWASGELNWKFINGSEDLTGDTAATKGMPNDDLRFYRSTGMRVYGERNSWVALKIKSPGNGDFTISLNHGTCGNSGTVALYVLPGDTDVNGLWQATDPENRVGKVLLANKTGSSTIEDGATSFVGYWNFEAGKEYILILECYDPSPYNAKRAYMHLSQIVMERGKIEYEAEEAEKKINSVVVADNALPIADACTNGALMDINGHDWYFLPVEGGYMLVYDLDTGKLMDKVYTGISRATEVLVTKDQKIVLAAASSFVYDPYTGESYRLANWKEVPGLEDTNDPNTLCMGEDGKIMWMGSTYGAYLAKYDFETKEYTYLGQPYGYKNRISGLNYRDGYLYGYVSGGMLFKWDTNTNQIVAERNISEYMTGESSVSSVSFLGDKYIVVGGSYMKQAIVLDRETFEPVDLNMFANPNLCVTEEIDGKHYMVLQGYGLYEYDIATETVSKVPGFDTSGIGFRTCGQNSFGKSIITKDGELCLFTYTASGGHPRMFNLDKKEYQGWDNLVVDGGGGAPIRTILSWGEGSNRFSFGGFNTDTCAVYNTQLGGIEFYYKTGGQTDSHVWYDGKLYAGNYSSTTLNEIYPDETMTTLPTTNEVIQRWKLEHDGDVAQKRVHILAAGDGYVFAGTTPNSNLNGGGITVYDTKTGRWKFHRSPVQNGSINGLAYHDEVLFGTTSGKGGSGAIQDPDYSGVVFAYDYKNQEVLATLDPRDYIQGLKSPVDIIYGVTVDPNVEENGRIWSIVANVLFCFTYDKENRTFQVQEVISFGKTTYTNSSSYGWWPRGIQFDTERSRIYATFAQGGGAQCIEIEDMNAPVGQIKVKSNERFMADIPEGNFYILGEDGNFYYGLGEDLKMFPLNVTEEEWAIAQQVDDMILSIPDEITVETEALIRTVRSAYENLDWRYKALIQKLEILQEAESDILERKIDAYDGVEMTADHYPEMTELMQEYAGLNTRQQRYVKNYDKLKTAYDTASGLNDQRIAAAMQEKINGLQEKFPLTLDDEAEVLEIRAEYDTLTAKQSVLVDATILLDAEEQIKKLRAEYVIYVEELIQAIPKEITLEAEDAILAARAAADKLYTNERKNVSYSKLTSAEGKLRTLKAAKAKADPVVAMIDAIGTVWQNDAQAIAEARAAYEALSETERVFVTNYEVLVAAEERLVLLQTWTVPVIVGGSVILLLAAALVIFRKKIFKGKKKVIDN